MSDKEIIDKWKIGFSKFQIANDYMERHNKTANNKKDTKKITKLQALAYVEPIIFKYQVSLMKGE